MYIILLNLIYYMIIYNIKKISSFSFSVVRVCTETGLICRTLFEDWSRCKQMP